MRAHRPLHSLMYNWTGEPVQSGFPTRLKRERTPNVCSAPARCSQTGRERTVATRLDY